MNKAPSDSPMSPVQSRPHWLGEEATREGPSVLKPGQATQARRISDRSLLHPCMRRLLPHTYLVYSACSMVDSKGGVHYPERFTPPGRQINEEYAVDRVRTAGGGRRLDGVNMAGGERTSGRK